LGASREFRASRTAVHGHGGKSGAAGGGADWTVTVAEVRPSENPIETGLGTGPVGDAIVPRRRMVAVGPLTETMNALLPELAK